MVGIPWRNVKFVNVAYEPGDELKFPGNLGNKIILAASPTLKELEFDGHSFSSLAGTVFPKLEKVTTYCTLYKVYDRERFGQGVTDSFTNLKYLNTASDHLISMPMMGKLEKLPVSLNRLVLHGISDTTGGLECLLEIPGSLRELNFSVDFQIDDRVDDMPTIFYTFLKKIPPLWKYFPSACSVGNMVTGLLEFGTMPGYFGPIDYAECFPVVEILEIWSCSDAFIPSQNHIQVVESVKRIDLGVVRRWNNVVDFAKLYTRMFDIFPNAKESVIKLLKDLFFL
ncbi:hypothetical protein Fcan01_15377 [Folsomia candida]|uniref:Uncharacterized protein n=1 Tax=Folsomia candida TaxID=158441 RepID=A0A226DYI0_FOLCA|nr:hypothetical protein Fcan01_15377 [Folsomia candida]